MDRDARRTNSGQWDDPVLSALSATGRDGSHTPEIGTGANVEKTIWLEIAKHDQQFALSPQLYENLSNARTRPFLIMPARFSRIAKHGEVLGIDFLNDLDSSL